MTTSLLLPTSSEDDAWRGWKSWTDDAFENLAGPFYMRDTADGMECAFRLEMRHMNAASTLHGGCMAAFADFAIFALSLPLWIEQGGVTVALNCQFLGPARCGDLVKARALSVHRTVEFVFVTGAAHVADAPIVAFNGIIKMNRLAR